MLYAKSFTFFKYSEVIKACCLTQDFDELEDGDDTLCSSNTLSGGQKVRITLARAVYQVKNRISLYGTTGECTLKILYN